MFLLFVFHKSEILFPQIKKKIKIKIKTLKSVFYCLFSLSQKTLFLQI